MDESESRKQLVSGIIKWFDATRGFGFLAVDDDSADVLLHANVLRNFGQSSVADGALVEVMAQNTSRGMQATEVLSIQPPAAPGATPPIADLDGTPPEELDQLPLLPARVKWFDKAKGFGFANIFAQKGDVFLHIEVLRHCGFADLTVGEAIAIRVVEGRRGMMAAQITAWDRATDGDGTDGSATGEDLHAKPHLAVAGG